MKWFKMWTESRTDAKLNSLSDPEFRVWHNLLCYAAEQIDPGTIKNYDKELLIIEVTRCNGNETDCNAEILKSTLERLVKLQIITHENNTIIFKNFKKRNEKPKNATPEEIKKRVTKHRESKKSKSETACNGNETDLKRPVTGCNAPEAEAEVLVDQEKSSTPPTPSIEPPTNPPVLHIDIKKLNLLLEEETKKRDTIDNDPAADEDPPENITWIKPTEVEFNRLKKHFATHKIRLTDNCINKLLNRGYTVEQVIDTADQVANRYHREGRTISCDCDYWFLHSVMSKVSPQNLTAQEMQRRHDAELEKLYPTLN